MNSNLSLNFNSYFNFFFFLAPIFVSLGSAATNLYSIILLIFCIIWKFKNKIILTFFSYEKYLFLFIVYTLAINLYLGNISGLIKVVNLLLFFFIILVFKNFKENLKFSNKIKNLYLVFFLLIIIDSLTQFFIGKNIFGIELAAGGRVSGIFGDEAILGSFMSKFFIMITGLLLFNSNNNKFFRIGFIFYFLLFLIIIFLSGERVAFLIAILSLFFYFFYVNKFKHLLTLFLICIIFIIILLKSNLLNNYKETYLKFFADLGISNTLSEKYSTQNYIDQEHSEYIHGLLKGKKKYTSEWFARELGITVEKVEELRANNKNKKNNFLNSYHGGLFLNSIILTKDNIFFGTGIKQYRIKCVKNSELFNGSYAKNFYYKNNLYKLYCSTHPHNIYLEILVETGLIGFIIFILFVLTYLKSIMTKPKDNFFSTIIVTNLTLFFPFTTTGSFFSSSYFIYFLFFILLGTSYKSKNV
tara:strand:- start:278 stop:1690 length:1413 start_codon:yes stop_codon:yes gene_type:complete